VAIAVRKCGLVVDVSLPWLAASPDEIVSDPTLKENNQGSLEVKCPFSCEKIAITKACRTVPAFCLVMSKDGSMCLSESHSYFYQLQTQMHVTDLQWCDFVVWSPHDIFVQRIKYDPVFMKSAISTAGKFYFQHFLPAVVPHVIIPPAGLMSPNFSIPSISAAAQIPVSIAVQTPVSIAAQTVSVAAKMQVSIATQSESAADKMPVSVAAKMPVSVAANILSSVSFVTQMPFSVAESHTQASSTLLPKSTSLSTPWSTLPPPSSVERQLSQLIKMSKL